MESNLNDRWSRIAAQATETQTKPQSFRPAVLPATEQPKPGSAMEIAGVPPEAVRKYFAERNGMPVQPADKKGRPATQLDTVMSLWIDVTPDMATRWLRANFRNRAVSDDTVLAYARDMLAGRWQPTHQGIAFNDRDQLIDGQHRLMAVVRIAKPVRMMVTFGLPSQIAGAEMTTMDCVDRGRTRSVGDQLKIQHGLKGGAQIASVAASLAHLCVGERVRRLSVGQTLDTYRLFEPGVNYVLENRAKESGLKSAAVLAAFAFAYSVKGAEVKWRFAMLNTGQEIEGSPVLRQLREFLLANESLVMMRNLHRGIVEFVSYAIWMDMVHHREPLSQQAEEWLKGVEFFRAEQRERVAKVANLFKLAVTK